MKYFGTDGIRGEVGKVPIDAEFFERLAHAIEKFFLQKYKKKDLTVCLGMDTRKSGIALRKALLRGFSSGTKVLDCKILPTPAISGATIWTKSDAGIMITASHNPSSDNGIKIFNARGEKLSAEEEEEIERIIDSGADLPLRSAAAVDFHRQAQRNYCSKYENFLPNGALSGKTIVVDSANGATSAVAKKIFESLGLNVIQIGNRPNGKNINDGCGSEHPGNLANFMKNSGAFAGIAFDGDGDRVVIFDETGEKISGDVLIGRIAIHMAKAGNLPNETIVTTIQSNMGLDRYLKSNGIDVIRCDVGDRNVYQAMLKNNCPFGGENSGHLIFSKFSPIGDGITAALHVLLIAVEGNINLSKLKTNIALFHQKSFNISVREEISLSGFKDDAAKAQSAMSPDSRILVRHSGTESKVRVLVESPFLKEVEHAWEKLEQSMLERANEDATISSF
ncbi:MAG: hypothetical protein LBI56_01595 [Puniceicoccales bacterium]|jgi:phosphoglucosamine mutase|nr:hypothetical protein [Puniceicoccales bacterium]